MSQFGNDEGVKIDIAHAMLLTGLIVANKPKVVLELGIGGGQGTDAILSGLDYNQQQYDYTLVDNWNDFGFRQPPEVAERYGNRINSIITSNEQDFVFGCNKTFDFIMSDADHMSADQWFKYVFDNLLNPGGILIYHDINLFDDHAFKNLISIYNECKSLNLKHKLFNKNSLPNEQCQRGLLIIFKDD